MKRRFGAITAAAAMLTSFMCSYTASAAYVIPGNLRLPDWVPQNFIDALKFQQEYGTTHIEDDVICIVQRKQHYQQAGWEDNASFTYNYHPDPEKGQRTDSEPQWNEKTYQFEGLEAPDIESPDYPAYCELCMQIGWEPDLAVSGSIVDFGYTVLAYEIIPDTDLDVCLQTTCKKDGEENPEVISEKHYTFTSVYDATIENIKITETDLYGWLPDCLSEYSTWIGENGNIAAKNGYIVYADDVCIDGGYQAFKEFSGTGLVTPVNETYIADPRLIPPVGGTTHEICVYEPKRAGTVGIRVRQMRDFEPNAEPVSDIYAGFSITADGEIKPVEKEEIEELQPGDCDGKAGVTVSDAVILEKYLFGEETLGCWQNADLNKDSHINAIDLTLLKRMLFSQDVPVPPDPAKPNEDLLYTVPLRFDVSSDFKLSKENPIRVYEIGEDGIVSDEPMSSTVDIPVVYSDGTPVYNGSGAKQWLKDQPRVEGDLENGFEIRLPRYIGKNSDGKNKVEIQIYAEKTFFPVPGGPETEKHTEDVLISKIDLTYNTIAKDTSGKTEFYEELGKRFVIQENGDRNWEDYKIPQRPGQIDTPVPLKLSLSSEYEQYGPDGVKVKLNAAPQEQSKGYLIQKITVIDRTSNNVYSGMIPSTDSNIWSAVIECGSNVEGMAAFSALAELVPYNAAADAKETIGVWSNELEVPFLQPDPAP